MAEIEVRQKGLAFEVKVREGASQTEHEVDVPDDFYRQLTGGKQSKEDCVKAAFRFLLEREPKEAIVRRFDLPVIGRYFPEFEREYSSYV